MRDLQCDKGRMACPEGWHGPMWLLKDLGFWVEEEMDPGQHKKTTCWCLKHFQDRLSVCAGGYSLHLLLGHWWGQRGLLANFLHWTGSLLRFPGDFPSHKAPELPWLYLSLLAASRDTGGIDREKQLPDIGIGERDCRILRDTLSAPRLEFLTAFIDKAHGSQI